MITPNNVSSDSVVQAKLLVQRLKKFIAGHWESADHSDEFCMQCHKAYRAVVVGRKRIERREASAWSAYLASKTSADYYSDSENPHLSRAEVASAREAKASRSLTGIVGRTKDDWKPVAKKDSFENANQTMVTSFAEFLAWLTREANMKPSGQSQTSLHDRAALTAFRYLDSRMTPPKEEYIREHRQKVAHMAIEASSATILTAFTANNPTEIRYIQREINAAVKAAEQPNASDEEILHALTLLEADRMEGRFTKSLREAGGSLCAEGYFCGLAKWAARKVRMITARESSRGADVDLLPFSCDEDSEKESPSLVASSVGLAEVEIAEVVSHMPKDAATYWKHHTEGVPDYKIKRNEGWTRQTFENAKIVALFTVERAELGDEIATDNEKKRRTRQALNNTSTKRRAHADFLETNGLSQVRKDGWVYAG